MKTKLDRRLEEAFKDVDRQEDAGALRRVQEVCRAELMGRRRERASFSELLRSQLKGMGLWLWITEGGLLAAGLGSFVGLGGQWISGEKMLLLFLSALSLLGFLAGVPVLTRGNRFRMSELEATSHFSPKRLLLARLLILGTGDALFLGGLMIPALLAEEMRLGGVFGFLLVPFLAASLGGTALLGRGQGESFAPSCAGICGGLALVMTFLAGNCPEWFLEWGGIAFAAVLAAALIYETHDLFARASFWEPQLR